MLTDTWTVVSFGDHSVPVDIGLQRPTNLHKPNSSTLNEYQITNSLSSHRDNMSNGSFQKEEPTLTFLDKHSRFFFSDIENVKSDPHFSSCQVDEGVPLLNNPYKIDSNALFSQLDKRKPIHCQGNGCQ